MTGNTGGERVAAGSSGKTKEAPHSFTISLVQLKDYEFRVRFDKRQHPDLLMDEPPPLGGDTGPNASRILAAAVGNCLCASLLFCMRKARAVPRSVSAEVKVEFRRDERGRVRIARMDVEIVPVLDESDAGKAQRCLEIFEDFCVVTQSVRQGIEVGVRVRR